MRRHFVFTLRYVAMGDGARRDTEALASILG